MDEKNWKGLFSQKGIEMSCFLPEFFIDMPTEKLRSVMKVIAQENFVIPIDGGVFRTVADNGSFL